MAKGELNFEVIKEYGVIGEGSKGWTKQVNMISWNGRAPKIDIRDWSEDRSKMGKGLTLSEKEAAALAIALVLVPSEDFELPEEE
jgi:hypothetical protein